MKCKKKNIIFTLYDDTFRLNNEIKKVTENGKALSELSNSNYKVTEQQCINDQFLDLKIWNDQPNNNTKYSTDQYLTKFEYLKKANNAKKEKENITSNNNFLTDIFNHSPDIDEFDNNDCDEVDENDEHGVINKISSIKIKHPNFGSTNPTSSQKYIPEKNYRCMTEPDENFFTRPTFPLLNATPTKNGTIDVNYSNPYFHYSLMNSFNSGQLNNIGLHANKGSFVSTQYSSNKIYQNNYGSNEDMLSLECDEISNDK